MWENLPLFPTQASKLAPQVDAVFFFLVIVTLLLLGVDCVPRLVFRDQVPQGEASARRTDRGIIPLELTWTLIPLGISMVMFVWGAGIYFIESRPPNDAMEVYVVGKQWMWKFQHVEGVREINQLARSRGPGCEGDHDLAGRDPRLLRARVPYQGRRDPRPLHGDLVPSDEAGNLSHVLRAILRHRALRTWSVR